MSLGKSPSARVLLFLACLLLILARMNGTHLHLCFDGSEPRSSLHLVEDAESDFHFGANSSHEDLDVSLVGNAVVKHDASGIDLLPVLLGLFIVLGLLRRAATWAPYPERTLRFVASVFALRPPTRGPPA